MTPPTLYIEATSHRREALREYADRCATLEPRTPRLDLLAAHAPDTTARLGRDDAPRTVRVLLRRDPRSVGRVCVLVAGESSPRWVCSERVDSERAS